MDEEFQGLANAPLKRRRGFSAGHWSIENTLHWQWDVTFREDDSRVRDRRLTNNLAWLRRFAISLLKRHPSSHSIKGKAQMAGWNNDFLLQVLTAEGV